MRLLLGLLGVSAMIGLAAPAFGDPDGGFDNTGFLATVRDAGINYTSSGQAIAFAKAVCGWISNGKSGPELGGRPAKKQFGVDHRTRNLVPGDLGKVLLPATTQQESAGLGPVAANRILDGATH